jgi:hypothetical protein
MLVSHFPWAERGVPLYGALLGPRHSRRYCLFDLGVFSKQSLSVSAVQYQFNPERHPAAAKRPECVRRDIL